MGIRIGGRAGPVSASVPASGCGGPVLGLLVLFAALGALHEYWKYALAIVVIALAGLAIFGRIYARHGRNGTIRKAREAATAQASEPQAAVSDRR